MMEIIGGFEDDLGIMISDEKLAVLQTVGDLENAVQEQLSKKHARPN